MLIYPNSTILQELKTKYRQVVFKQIESGLVPRTQI